MNGWELVIIFVLALVLIGPERLPHYLARARKFVRETKKLAEGAKVQLREQMGPEFDEIDWKAYDPRQYDPRRIVREALLETDDDDDPAPRTGATATTPEAFAAASQAPGAVAFDPDAPTPFDPEAT